MPQYLHPCPDPSHSAAPAVRQGYIYVEADKESHVKDNMNGLQGLMWTKGVKQVPIAEMVDAVTVNTKAKQKVELDSWVRVRSGVYAGDLARVHDIDAGAGRATIMIVPRLDYSQLAKKERVPFGHKPKVTPPPHPRLPPCPPIESPAATLAVHAPFPPGQPASSWATTYAEHRDTHMSFFSPPWGVSENLCQGPGRGSP